MSVFIGIELGSTRIKAVAIDEHGKPLASGKYDWENRLVSGIWTYSLDEAWKGLQESFKELSIDFALNQGKPMGKVSGIGISAMMHGYLVFDKDGKQLTEFRTWRNTITGESADLLTETFNFNIPQRWSIAHLHHAVSGGEAHVKDIACLTTLAGYIHYKLTGKNVVGIGEASGIFPIDSNTSDYNADMLTKFDELISGHNVPWKIKDILPKVLNAGENAGRLTEEGARLLDPTGHLKPRVPLCPPEGDAGAGMVATNAIMPHTGNISAGTSVFAMLVMETELCEPHREIDMITTPAGSPVAMVHVNNCTADLDAWIGLFADSMELVGNHVDISELYSALYNAALEGDADCGDLVSVNYLSGEHLTGFSEGRPLFIRTPNSKFTVPNFMRSLLFSSMATLRIGMDILVNDGVVVSKLLGHGGLFKTPVVAQKLMASALNIPVAVMESAGEGGAWGIALLAVYSVFKGDGETLQAFLDKRIFANSPTVVIEPNQKDAKGFEAYLERYKKALMVEKTAVEQCGV